MKRFRRQFVFGGLILLTCLGIIFGARSSAVAQEIQNQPTDYSPVATQQSIHGTETASCLSEGQKIDLNNANALVFMDCPGYYSTLAKEIITHGPYDSVEEVMGIPGLSEQQ